MDAVFELLQRNPKDDRLLLAALGVAESESMWISLTKILSDSSLSFDITSRTYIESFTRCIESTDVTVWPMKQIEQILVTCLPRWGSLIPKQSLAPLLGLVCTIVKNGLCVGPSTHSGRIKREILRVIWYSSALSVIISVLRTSLGESEEVMTNILLKHNMGNEKDSQSIVVAQEKALDCLAALLIASKDKSLEQLSAFMKQASQDNLDSSSLPIIVSVSSFLAGLGGVKVRPETVDAAAGCLAGFIDICDISPSLFSSRVKTLGTQLVTAAVEAVKTRKSQACVKLLDTMVIRSPSLVLQSEDFLAAVQTEQVLFRSVTALESVISIKEIDTQATTSGRAVVLSRLNDKAKAIKFLETTIGDPEWVNTHIVPSPETVKRIGNFVSFLQSCRIKLDSTSHIHEPSLVHIVRAARGSPDMTLGIDVKAVNEALESIDSNISLLRSCKLLFMSLTGGEVCERIKLSLLACFAKLDSDVIRECPKIVNGMLEILELSLETIANSTALKVKSPEASSAETRAILVKLLMEALEFSKDKEHMEVIESAFRCLPFVIVASNIADDLNSVSSLLDYIQTVVSPSAALTSIPSVLPAMEALVQATAVSLDSTLRSRIIEFIVSILGEASRTSGSIQKPVWIHLLSFVSSTLVVLGPDNRVSSIAWILLSSHSAIQEAAAAASWDSVKLKYSTNHLIWIQALNLAMILISMKLTEGSDRFFTVHADTMAETFSTAHTSDLATLEEACLISRLYELSESANIRPLPSPFQFTSLVTFKPPSVYPKSRAEKMAGNLADLCGEDVQSPCEMPSVFAQRVVWIASDILSSSLRKLSRSQTTGDSNLFHSLLDCSHFILQYLAEVGSHKARVLKTVTVGSEGSYVPLSVQLSVDGRQLSSALPQRRSVGGSLLSSMSSPPIGAAKNPIGPASLMDSLTPKNSPRNEDATNGGDGELKFMPPLTGDCPFRTGLSFVAPALMTEDDFLGKLVEVVCLCLVLASRMAYTESTIRPLLDLLLTTKSNGSKIPSDAFDVVCQVIDVITPRYTQLTNQQKNQQSHHLSPQIKPSLPYSEKQNPLGFAAISNLR
jgi:hypothetical protein